MPPESGHQAELAEGLDEARRARRQDDVAGQREIGTRAGGNAVDGAQHRPLEALQAADQRVVQAIERGAEVDRLARDLPLAEVLAGAERAPGAGQQHGADRPVELDPVERVGELRVHRLVEGVEAVRPVQGDRRDAIGDLQENRRLCHGFHPGRGHGPA